MEGRNSEFKPALNARSQICSIMSSAPPPIPPANEPEKQPDPPAEQTDSSEPNADAAMDTTPDQPAEETWEDIPVEVMALSTDEILTRIRLIENDIKVCCSSFMHSN
jgi:26S proteasome regulatory subunit T5